MQKPRTLKLREAPKPNMQKARKPRELPKPDFEKIAAEGRQTLRLSTTTFLDRMLATGIMKSNNYGGKQSGVVFTTDLYSVSLTCRKVQILDFIEKQLQGSEISSLSGNDIYNIFEQAAHKGLVSIRKSHLESALPVSIMDLSS